MIYAITGATGHLGRIVVEKMKAKTPSENIVALVRSRSKAEDLGVASREFDYAKPETLAAALQGVDALLLISSNEIGKRARQHENVIEAAKQAGVGRIVYTSLLHADTTPLSLGPEHLATERLIQSSGIPYTILRNGWYHENFDSAIGSAVASAAILGSAEDGKISSASREDFAEAAAAALTGEGHEGKTYELAGDQANTLADLAAEVSRQTGTPVVYKDLPEADYAATLAGFGLPKELASAIASWDRGAAEGALFNDERQLSKLIGRPTTPLSAAVAKALKPAST